MAMVYIVTSGSYSEYGIRKVFLDKSKAETYLLHCGYADAGIEEWEASDDQMDSFKSKWFVNGIYSVDENDKEQFHAYITKQNTLDSDNFEILKRTEYKENEFVWRKVSLSIYGVQCRTENEWEEIERMKKIITEKMSEIASLRINEDWTVEMINDYLKKQ